MQDPKIVNIRHLGTIAQLCRGYMFATKAYYRQSEKSLLNSTVSPHVLRIWWLRPRPTSGWDLYLFLCRSTRHVVTQFCAKIHAQAFLWLTSRWSCPSSVSAVTLVAEVDDRLRLLVVRRGETQSRRNSKLFIKRHSLFFPPCDPDGLFNSLILRLNSTRRLLSFASVTPAQSSITGTLTF